jgi:16S rRNA G527 N7-methylase RsmG
MLDMKNTNCNLIELAEKKKYWKNHLKILE